MKLIVELTEKDILRSLKDVGDIHDKETIKDVIGDDVTLTLDNIIDSIDDGDTADDACNLLSLLYLLGNKKWQEVTD